MILFIYHDACPCPKKHGGAAAHRMLRIQPGQLSTHQMPLVEQQPIFTRQIIHTHEHVMLETRRRAHRLAHARQHPQPFAVARATRKGKTLEIAREADARGQHDARVIARRIEPTHAAVRQQRQVQRHSNTLI